MVGNRSRDLAVLADDLTGAHAAAARLSAGGLAPQVIWDKDALPTTGPIVINMRTRDWPLDARAEARSWADALVRSGRSTFELRIDSTLRGSPAAELAGLLEATGWSEPLVVAVPAYPSAGRITRAGKQHIHDQGVLSREIDVASVLFPHSAATVVARPESGGAEMYERAIRELVQSGSRRVIIDAESELDLAAAAGAIAALRGDLGPVVTVSSSSWLRYHSQTRDGFHLVIYASPTKTNVRQLSRLLEQDPAADVYGMADRTRSVRPGSLVVIETLSSAAPTRPPAPWAAETAAQVLAAARVDDLPCRGVVVSGGHAAACLLDQLEARFVEPIEETEPLCPRGVIHGGPWDGLSLTTKGGQIGDDDTLLGLLEKQPNPWFSSPPIHDNVNKDRNLM